MKAYTIVSGVNGSGKSSLLGILKTETTNLGKIIDVDKITVKCNENPIECRKQTITLIEKCLDKGITCTQETDLSDCKTLATIKKAIENGFYIRLYYVSLNTVEENISRIENRVKKGGHNIYAEDVVRRFNKRFNDLKNIIEYCDQATFYDNENGFVAVAAYKNGELLPIEHHSPEWLDS